MLFLFSLPEVEVCWVLLFQGARELLHGELPAQVTFDGRRRDGWPLSERNGSASPHAQHELTLFPTQFKRLQVLLCLEYYKRSRRAEVPATVVSATSMSPCD